MQKCIKQYFVRWKTSKCLFTHLHFDFNAVLFIVLCCGYLDAPEIAHFQFGGSLLLRRTSEHAFTVPPSSF